ADKSVRLWNAVDGKEVKNLGAHTGAVYAVAFSSDSKQLASAGQDMTVKVWDVVGMKEVKTMKVSDIALTGIAFSQDGKSVLTVGLDRFLRVWDIVNDAVPQKLPGKEIKKFGPTDYD